MPKVSVVIPAYNSERYVGAAVRSALGQDYGDLEVVAVDDGSTDGTLGILRTIEAEDERLRVIATPNQGVERTRNRGIAESRGEWIAFLDADDVWETNKLSLQLAFHAEHPEVVMSSTFGRFIGTSENAHSVGVIEFGVLSEAHAEQFRNSGGVVHLLTSSVLVRKDVLEEFGSFDPAFRHGGEDVYLWTLINEQYPVRTLNEYLVRYRVTQGSATMKEFRRMRMNVRWMMHHFAKDPEDREPFSQERADAWYASVDPATVQRWEREWRADRHYRAAAHALIERHYLRGAWSMVRSLLVDPARPFWRLKRQVWPHVKKRLS